MLVQTAVVYLPSIPAFLVEQLRYKIFGNITDFLLALQTLIESIPTKK